MQQLQESLTFSKGTFQEDEKTWQLGSPTGQAGGMRQKGGSENKNEQAEIFSGYRSKL